MFQRFDSLPIALLKGTSCPTAAVYMNIAVVDRLCHNSKLPIYCRLFHVTKNDVKRLVCKQV